MNRREFGKKMALGSAGTVLVGAAPSPGAAAPDPRTEQSPHAGALELTFQKAAGRIRAVDQENWWHDVKERAWVVQRPFMPGVIDSTHLFTVRYRIGGKEVASWLVDTRRQTVEEQKP
jgi:hypothetical protein